MVNAGLLQGASIRNWLDNSHVVAFKMSRCNLLYRGFLILVFLIILGFS